MNIVEVIASEATAESRFLRSRIKACEATRNGHPEVRACEALGSRSVRVNILEVIVCEATGGSRFLRSRPVRPWQANILEVTAFSMTLHRVLCTVGVTSRRDVGA